VGVVFSGISGDGHEWLPLSNVADQEIVYVRPARELVNGTERTTFPVPAPETVFVVT
jgi:hypothetical protein